MFLRLLLAAVLAQSVVGAASNNVPDEKTVAGLLYLELKSEFDMFSHCGFGENPLPVLLSSSQRREIRNFAVNNRLSERREPVVVKLRGSYLPAPEEIGTNHKTYFVSVELLGITKLGTKPYCEWFET